MNGQNSPEVVMTSSKIVMVQDVDVDIPSLIGYFMFLLRSCPLPLFERLPSEWEILSKPKIPTNNMHQAHPNWTLMFELPVGTTNSAKFSWQRDFRPARVRSWVRVVHSTFLVLDECRSVDGARSLESNRGTNHKFLDSFSKSYET